MACFMSSPSPARRRFGADVANRLSVTPVAMTPDTLKLSTATFAGSTPNAMYRARTHSPRPRSAPPAVQAKSTAVPFPTISEENPEDEAGSAAFFYDRDADETRGRDWAAEIARRQENIKELRDRKIRLEQAQASRFRKSSGTNGISVPVSVPLSASGRRSTQSYLTSPDRKLTADDIDFLSALHASVVWRLWHVELRPEVFASERLLATRLHLVLMRHGRQNIPVPPIVAVSKSHHLMQSFAAKHMMERDRKDIQSLPQLVAKSLLRQRKTQGRKAMTARNLEKRSLRAPLLGDGNDAAKRSSVVYADEGRRKSSPLAQEPLATTS